MSYRVMLRRYLFVGLVICALAAVIIPYFVENYSGFLYVLNQLRDMPEPPAKPKQQVPLTAEQRIDETAPVDMELQAWLIALANFNDSANAEHLVEKLQELGFSAFINKDNNVYHVYVGPVLKIDEARELIAKIYEQTQLKGTLAAYDPVVNMME